MRQVEDMVNFITVVIFNKKTKYYEVSEDESKTDTDMLFERLTELIRKGKLNEAENLLFENLDKDNTRYLELAVDFYSRLNKLDDSALENCDFSREEIDEGLKEVIKIYDISII